MKDDYPGLWFKMVFYIIDDDFIQVLPVQIVSHVISIHKAVFSCAKERDLLYECTIWCSRLLFLSVKGAKLHQRTNRKRITFSDFLTQLLKVEGYKYVKNGGTDSRASYI